MSQSDSAIVAEEAPPARMTRFRDRVLSFLVGQLALQAITAVTGLALLRWMSDAEYAKTSVAFGFQTVISLLTDLGVSNCIIALSGERAHDPAVVGRYISAASALRKRMFWIMTIVSVCAFPLVTRTQHWGFWTKLSLLGSVLLTIYFQNWNIYQSALTINGRMNQFYSIQVGVASGRLSFSYLAHLLSIGSGTVISWINALAVTAIGFFSRNMGGKLIVLPTTVDKEAQKEIMRYLTPSLPGIVFTAFQSQITIFLLTIFGQTRDIAEIAVLGRLGHLFLLLVAFNSAIIEPFFARLPVEQVPKRYIQAVFLGALFSAGLIAFVYFFPQPVLWLISNKYANLQKELAWTVASSAVGYLAGMLWAINSARKWIYWWYTVFYIVIILAAQIVSVCFLKLSNLHDVVLFSLFTSLAAVTAHLCAGIYGMITRKTAT